MKKIVKIFSIIAASFLLFLVLFLFLFRIFSPSYLVPYLIKQVEEETNGRYALSVNSDSLRIRFVSMTVRLGQTEFRRDSSVNDLSGIEFLDKFDVDASFESFDIHALNMLRYIFSEKFIVDQISLKKPKIIIKKNRAYLPATNSENQKAEIKSSYLADSVLADTLAWGEFKSSGGLMLPHLIVEQFEIADAHFSFYDGRKKYPVHEVNGFTFNVKGFELIEQSGFNIIDGSIHIDSASSLLSKNTARLRIQGMDLDPEAFHIDSLHFGHVVDKYRINRIKGFRASWLDISVLDINITGLHPNRFISDSVVLIDKASIGEVYFNLFKDKSEPKINPEYKPLPQEIIRNIPAKIEIDTIEILDADLIIDMQAPKANVPGQITLLKSTGLITNLSNVAEELEKNPFMEIQLKTMVMDKIPVTIDYKMNMNSEEDQFWASCKIKPFEASILNGFLGSQFFIEFKSGYVDNLEFNFEGNNKANVGEIDFEYTKLKIQKLKGYESYIAGKPKTGFISAVGNILIPNNRSKNDKKYKTGAIYYEKEFNRPLVHVTIMSVLSGVLSSMGLTSRNLEKQKEKADALDSTAIQKSEETVIKQTEKIDKKKEVEMEKELKVEDKKEKKKEKKENNN